MSLSKVRWKDDVRIKPPGLTPHQAIMVEAARKTRPSTYGDIVMVTSANDGKHSDESYHYKDAAIDVRVRSSFSLAHGNVRVSTLAEAIDAAEAWAEDIRLELGPQYDVVVEHRNEIAHLHLEYDPQPAEMVP